MLTDILCELEEGKLLYEKASKRLDSIEISQENWNDLIEVRELLHKLEGKIIKLSDALSMSCACLDYYSNSLRKISSKPVETLQDSCKDPLNNNEKMQYLSSLIGGFNTLEDVKQWRNEVLTNQSDILEEIVSLDSINESIEEWANAFFISMDYIEGLLRGFTLTQDKRINSSEETIMAIYLGLSKYYMNRYKCIKR